MRRIGDRVMLNFSHLQLFVLRLMAKVRLSWERVPLFFPFGWLYCGGRLPLASYREVFVDEVYAPPIPLPPPVRILDIGAHIGLATLYFAGRYPDAQIDSYEANPAAGTLLEKNLARLPNASAHSVAVGAGESRGELFVEDFVGVPTDASIVSRDPGKVGTLVSVEIRNIRHLIRGPTDIVKIDIEGAEYTCLEALAPDPTNIHCLVVEFHDYMRGKEKINKSLSMLRRSGYRLLDGHGRSIELPFAPQHDAETIWAVAL